MPSGPQLAGEELCYACERLAGEYLRRYALRRGDLKAAPEVLGIAGLVAHRAGSCLECQRPDGIGQDHPGAQDR